MHKAVYRPIPPDDLDTVQVVTNHSPARTWRQTLVFLLTLALLSTMIGALVLVSRLLSSMAPARLKCSDPSIRREWRTLSPSEQKDYLGAVQCLAGTPSKLHFGRNETVLDDFPWLHYHSGYRAHDSALFFSWHRYFVHVYEKKLHELCGYRGDFPYWDWTLDFRDPALSPVFDTATGFGGNGNASRPVDDHDAFCVDEGPFAELQTRYNGEQHHRGIHMVTNCLSRNFANHTDLGHFSGTALNPDYVNTLLALDDYIDFLLAIEEGPHDAIPIGLGGDFKSMTAPTDPIFFLHHAQLDRLWWIWQGMKPERRYAYNGPASRSADSLANLDDILFFKDLERDTTVAEIIDTRGGQLCYRYDRDVVTGEL